MKKEWFCGMCETSKVWTKSRTCDGRVPSWCSVGTSKRWKSTSLCGVTRFQLTRVSMATQHRVAAERCRRREGGRTRLRPMLTSANIVFRNRPRSTSANSGVVNFGHNIPSIRPRTLPRTPLRTPPKNIRRTLGPRRVGTPRIGDRGVGRGPNFRAFSLSRPKCRSIIGSLGAGLLVRDTRLGSLGVLGVFLAQDDDPRVDRS